MDDMITQLRDDIANLQLKPEPKPTTTPTPQQTARFSATCTEPHTVDLAVLTDQVIMDLNLRNEEPHLFKDRQTGDSVHTLHDVLHTSLKNSSSLRSQKKDMESLSGPALQSKLATFVQRIKTRRDMAAKSASGLAILSLSDTSPTNERKVAKAVLASLQVPLAQRHALAATAAKKGALRTLQNNTPYSELPGTIEIRSAPAGDHTAIASDLFC
jgi:hypothetical protein